MTREETKERIAVMQAYVDGKEIEFLDDEDPVWCLTSSPAWDPSLEYRIKPTPKYRPFESAEECWDEMLKHEPFGWVKDINNGELFQIQCVDGREGRYARSFEQLTFADGKPFGAIENQSK